MSLIHWDTPVLQLRVVLRKHWPPSLRTVALRPLWTHGCTQSWPSAICADQTTLWQSSDMRGLGSESGLEARLEIAHTLSTMCRVHGIMVHDPHFLYHGGHRLHCQFRDPQWVDKSWQGCWNPSFTSTTKPADQNDLTGDDNGQILVRTQWTHRSSVVTSVSVTWRCAMSPPHWS